MNKYNKLQSTLYIYFFITYIYSYLYRNFFIVICWPSWEMLTFWVKLTLDCLACIQCKKNGCKVNIFYWRITVMLYLSHYLFIFIRYKLIDYHRKIYINRDELNVHQRRSSDCFNFKSYKVQNQQLFKFWLFIQKRFDSLREVGWTDVI